MKRKAAFIAILGILSCSFIIFAFAAEAWANGVVSADEAPVAPDARASVRRAPVRRPAAQAAKQNARPSQARAQPQPQPPKVSSLQRGIALMEQERYGQARPWLQKAVQEERRNPWAWYWYGMWHDKNGQPQEAQFFYTRAVDLDPAFPPFVRVVTYPDDGNRIPLWDPLRPARVYPVDTGGRGIAAAPPGSPQSASRPARPAIDPDLPKVPVYIPPEPSYSPGDASQPPVYVPPPPTSERYYREWFE